MTVSKFKRTLFSTNKIFLTSLMLIFLSINCMAVNSGSPANDVHSEKRATSVVENSKYKTKKAERKKEKFTKRIQAFAKKLQTKSLGKARQLSSGGNAAIASVVFGLLGMALIAASSVIGLAGVWIGIIVAILAITIGIVGMAQIGKTGKDKDKQIFAILGILLGILLATFAPTLLSST